MRRRVFITGRGLVSPLGDSPRTLHAALCEGRSALGPITGFDTDGVGCRLGGEIRGFDPKAYLGKRNLRPLDRTSKLLAVAAHLALEESRYSPDLRREQEVGLVVGTMFGSVHTIVAFDRRAQSAGPGYASPLDFANTVINAAAGQVAIWHHLTGVNSTFAAGVTSGLGALAYARDLIHQGQARAVLAGGVEELCFESLYSFSRGGGLCASDSEASLAVPFDARRSGFALAEGAALVMLEDAESAIRRGAPILAEVQGSGCAFDVSGGRSEERSTTAMAQAMTQALRETTGLTASQEGAELVRGSLRRDPEGSLPGVGALSASANGSVSADRREARAIARVFGEGTARLPVTAVKSASGEALGASGALQAVALTEALATGVLPGIRGLEATEPDFPLLGARNARQPLAGGTGLVNSFGFEGRCASLVLRIPPEATWQQEATP